MSSQASQPLLDSKLPAEQRAELILHEMTLDENIALVHGEGNLRVKNLSPEMQHALTIGNGGGGGPSGEQQVRDLWRQKDLGSFDGELHAFVSPHWVVLLKVSPADK